MPAQLDDHFTLGLPLGRNAAGAVWQGEDKRDESTVAIAMVDLEDVADPALGRRLSTRFRRDLELLRKVDHPNIARVTEVGRDAEGRPFAAMEFVDGENLGDWLQKERTGAERVSIADGLLAGLEAAHRVGVTHGDLEPGNVLVTGEEVPKVIGFGLNRALARQAEPGWDANSGVARSLSYRAPEQSRGTGGTRTDVYALGLLLHRLLLDRLPHEPGGSKGLPAPIEAVVRKALATDPAERHVSVWAMRKAWGDAVKEIRPAIDAATKGFGELDAEPTRGGVVVDEPSVVVDDDIVIPPDAVSAGVEVPDEEPPGIAAGVAVPRSDPPLPKRGDTTLAGFGALEPRDPEEDLRSTAKESINPRPGRPAAPPKRVAFVSEEERAHSGRPSEPGMRISLTDVEIDPSPSPLHSAPPPPPPPPASPSRRHEAQPVSLSPAFDAEAGEEPPKAFPWPAVIIVLLVFAAGYFAFREQGDDAERRAASEDILPPTLAVEPEPEPVIGPPVRLTLHDLPAGSRVMVDGMEVAIEDDRLSFPNDGRRHALEVHSEGNMPWRQVLAAESPLDLLIVTEPDPDATPPSEAVVDPTELDEDGVDEDGVDEERARAAPPPVRTEMRSTRRPVTMRSPATMTSTMGGRPSIRRNPGF